MSSLQNEAHQLAIPTLSFVDRKVKEIEEKKNVNLKEEDIDQVNIDRVSHSSPIIIQFI